VHNFDETWVRHLTHDSNTSKTAKIISFLLVLRWPWM